MAILKIARMGHPVLMDRADIVDDPTAPEVQRLIADMIETMHDAGGVGLAAPQVHMSKRIVIFWVPGERDAEEGRGLPLNVLINPVIEPLSDERVTAVEGCLSLPGMSGLVPRYRKIRYTALSPNGEETSTEASGFHARVVQHECDHLDGILYPMRMEDLSSFGYTEEQEKAKSDAELEGADDDG